MDLPSIYSPFKLQSTVVASEISREPEFFALVTILPTARERSIGIGWAVSGSQSDKVSLI